MHSIAGAEPGTQQATSFARVRSGIPTLVWAITAVGAILRIIALGHKSFWLDEIASVAIAVRPGKLFWSWLWTHEGNMALYYVLLRLWLHLGLSEGTVRMLSVVPGIATIPMMYVLARRLFSGRAAMIAALLTAASPTAAVYSQEARGYSLLVFAVVLSMFLFVRLIENPGWATAAAYGAAGALSLYCHYFGILALVAQFASVTVLPRQKVPWKYLLASLAIIVLLGSPVLWMIRTQDVAHLDWVPKPSLLEVYHLGMFLASEGGKGVGAVLMILELPCIAWFIRSAARLWSDRLEAIGLWKTALVVSCLVAPVILTLLASVARPVFFHRFLIICLPAWLLLVAGGLDSIQRDGARHYVLIAVTVLSLVCVGLSYARVREDWRGAVGYLIAHASPEDRVLYYHPVGYFAAESYRDWLPGGKSPRPVGVLAFFADQPWEQQIQGANRIWLVRYPASEQDEHSRYVEQRLRAGYDAKATTNFRAISVTEYDRRQ